MILRFASGVVLCLLTASYAAASPPDVQISPEDPDAVPQLEALSATLCVGGMAGIYPCNNIDLLSFTPLAAMACSATNDVWGWKDTLTAKEYALVGCNNGTAFVDVTDPENPVYLGKLPTHTANSSWRDLEVYNNHVFVGSEASGHGLQVFDLTQLRTVPSPPVTFTETAHYPGFNNSHTININTATGFLYAVGTTNGGFCSGGLNMVNIQNPLAPVFVGCGTLASRGYVHDTHCITYNGPDVAHQGKEICLASNSTTSGGSGADRLTIVDVTTKASPIELSATTYPGSGFIHQGWITENHRYFLVDDELDETGFGHNTRTHMWNVSDLDAPIYMGFHQHATTVIDHNLYIKGDYAYESNYRAGLRIMNIADVANGNLSEFGFFDIYPSSDSPNFNGTWSNYPFLPSGNLIVVGIEQGLFMLRARLNPDFNLLPSETTLAACTTDSDSISMSLTPQDGYTGSVTLSAVGLPAGASADFSVNPVTVPGSSTVTVNTAGTATGDHPFAVSGTDGTRTHESNLTLRVADAVPEAPALVSPAPGASNQPLRPTFTWSAAPAAAAYDLQVAIDPAFADIVATAPGVSGTTHTLTADLAGNKTHYWRVRAVNGCGDGAYSAGRYFTTRALAAACPLGTTAAPTFAEGFESGDAGWTHNGTGDTWSLTGARPHGGALAFRATDTPTISDQRLVSPAITLPSGQSPLTLQFWNHQTIEQGPPPVLPPTVGCHDGAVLEISTDGGSNWSPLETELLTDPYHAPVPVGTNPLAGRNAWCGDPQDWLNSVVALDAYSGQSVRFRFRLGTNNSIGREGWYIDDVLVQSCTPNPTPTLTINDVVVDEAGDHGLHPNNALFTVSLSAASGQTVTLNYATADSNATAGLDYVAGSGSLTFAPGALTQNIDVTILNDAIREPNEFFFVNLSGAVGAGLPDAQGQGMIEGSPFGDFNADDKADILWLHDVSGQIVAWYMNGVSLISGTFTNPGALPDTGWKIVGTGDFNQDLETDILWRHGVSGQIAAWLMDGVTLTSGTFTTPSALADTNWQVAAAADFNSDGKSDILWRHAVSGQIAVWYMDGTTLINGTLTTPGSLADTNWGLMATGDFNRDGKTDLLWRHAVSGQIAVWFMDGVFLTGGGLTTPAALADTSWRIGGTGDYNHDGKTDILWRHGGSGQIAVWFMNGLNLIGGTLTTPEALPDVSWKIVGPK